MDSRYGYPHTTMCYLRESDGWQPPERPEPLRRHTPHQPLRRRSFLRRNGLALGLIFLALILAPFFRR